MEEAAMGDKSGKVVRLRLEEPARIDPVRLLQLRRELGRSGAAALFSCRVRALTATLARMEAMRAPGASDRQAEDFRRLGRRLSRQAGEVGLTRIAKVAEDVAALGAGLRDPAADATWARLLRLCAVVLDMETEIRRGRG